MRYKYRRILAIEAHAQWSSAGEVQLHRVIHDRYVVQLRVSLGERVNLL